MQIQNAAVTGSFTYNGVDISSITGSTSNITSLNAITASILSTTASLNAASGSAITRLSALEVTSGSNITRLSALESASGSAITRLSALEVTSGSNITRIAALEVTSGSNISRLSSLEARTGSYATTGSNTFVGSQTITGSILGSGSLSINGCIVSTGAIVAQTINVQQVTSSIVYSCGSNVFGTALNNTQTICGNIFSTGSLACFAGTICAPAFVGGTVSGTSATFSSNLQTNCVLTIGNQGVAGNYFLQITPSTTNRVSMQGLLAGVGISDIVMQPSSGNVGIGACSPQQILSVNNPFSSLNALYPIVISQTGNAEIGGIYSTADSITNPIGAGLAFKTYHINVGLSEKVRISNAGYVGIGTISPAALLSVEQDYTTTAEFGSFGQFSISGKTNSNKRLSFGFNTSTDVGFIQAMVNGTSYNSLLLNARGGNVGIGTICTLTQKFTIAGSFVRMESRSTDNTNAGVYYTVYNGASVVGQSTQAVTNTGDYLISTGTSSETERFRISGTGNTCIFCQLSIGPVLTVGNQGGTDTTTVGGGSGVGSLIRMNYAGGTMQNLFQGNGDNYVNCFTGKLNAAGGVKFAGGGSTLNYYEQGTWTPRLKNGSFTTNISGGNAGWYIRVGNIVTVGGTLSWTGGSGAQDGNSLQIACLPFSSNNTADHRSVGQFGAPAPGSIGFKNACAQMTLVVDPGASYIYLIEMYQSGTYLTYTHSPCVNTSGTIYGFQATYQI